MTNNARTDYQCSFCGKPQAKVRRLIAGPDRVFICDECVSLCGQIISEDPTTTHQDKSKSIPSNKLKPKAIFDQLEQYVVGQKYAKKVISVAVYNHYKRIHSQHNESDTELPKANVLMIGPPGSGKTYLAQTLAKILDVPYAIADATALTEAGYVGEDVENILLRLISAADFDIDRAEHGIIYIDEIDKIARKGSNPSITRDVSGEGVQQGLLKIIEGCVANVPPQGGRKHPHQEFMQIKTHNILFMCGGAFEGMSEIIEKRVFKDTRKLGFKSSSEFSSPTNFPEKDLFKHIAVEDLLEYGFIPEFVGRLPVHVGLEQLDQDALIQVLTEPKNALVKQYEYLFKMDNVDLEFEKEALKLTAQLAINQNSGARGLRTILEKTLLDIMYELPNLNRVSKCIVGPKAITGESSVDLISKSGSKLQFPQRSSTLSKKELKSA